MNITQMETNISTINSNIPDLGQQISSNSMSVTQASDSVYIVSNSSSKYSHYNTLLSLNASTNLAQNLGIATDTSTVFSGTDKFVDQVILTIIDTGLDSGEWGNGVTLANGYRLWYKPTGASSKIYLSNAILTNGQHCIYFSQSNYFNYGSGDEIVNFIMNFETPLFFDTTGSIGMEFVGADNYSSATSFSCLIRYHAT